VIQHHPYKVPAIMILEAKSFELFQTYISAAVTTGVNEINLNKEVL
jgi:uncharacterized protein involved in tolerance to divalent cations